MMAWYLFALVDAVPRGRPGRGLGGNLAVRRVPGGLAVVERRADVPPVEFGTLQKHQAVVARLADSVPAILPVRFGTLLETEEIEEALQDRDEEIADAFDLVRGRVQFTWRLRASGASAAQGRVRGTGASAAQGRVRGTGASAAQGRLRATGASAAQGRLRASGASATQANVVMRQTGGPSPGTDYLRRAARAARPDPPAVFRALRSKVAPLVSAERYQPASAQLPASLYHLVERSAVQRYEVIGEAVSHANLLLAMSGPFPPFAFAPEML
jgi:gas vesicle protein GvpL/GvpF